MVSDSVRRQSFDDDRASVLRTAVNAGARFDCTQARRLVSLFTFSSGQVEAAVVLHPCLTNPIGFESVLEAINFESDRERVRRVVRGGGAL
jgi:hypothetical protein